MLLVAQSCLTLYDPRNCSLSGASVHGILQARVLEWVAIPLSRGSSQPRDWTQVSCIAGRFFYHLSHQGRSSVYSRDEKLSSCSTQFWGNWSEAQVSWLSKPFPSIALIAPTDGFNNTSHICSLCSPVLSSEIKIQFPPSRSSQHRLKEASIWTDPWAAGCHFRIERCRELSGTGESGMTHSWKAWGELHGGDVWVGSWRRNQSCGVEVK